MHNYLNKHILFGFLSEGHISAVVVELLSSLLATIGDFLGTSLMKPVTTRRTAKALEKQPSTGVTECQGEECLADLQRMLTDYYSDAVKFH